MTPPEVPYVLVACTANTCRSPMAQKLLEHALNNEPAPLNSLKVISAGIGAIEGERAARNSHEALRKVGLSLENHSSRQITEDLVLRAQAVFVMTSSHLRMLSLSLGELPENTHLFRGFMEASQDREIPDPYGQNLPAYEACRDSMVEAIPSILRHLRRQAGLAP